jgi:hypothetical protein
VYDAHSVWRAFEIEHVERRATRAERWLEVIKNEIEVKLITPMEANRPELPALH